MTEKQIAKVKSKIRSLRARLSAEKRKFGGYDDSRGIRYVIAELYLDIGDHKGALRFFKWFDKEFPTDVAYPAFHLFWAMVLFEKGDIDEAIEKVYQSLFGNIHLIPLIAGEAIGEVDIPRYKTIDTKYHAVEEFPSVDKYITPGFREWLKELIDSNEFIKNRIRFINYVNKVDRLEGGSERSSLLKKQWAFEKSLTHWPKNIE